MSFVDVHAHLNDQKLIGDIGLIRQNYLKENVGLVVVSGYDLPSSKEAKIISERYPECYFTAGIHPDSCDTYAVNTAKEIENLSKHPKCLAIGEIGMDYHYEPQKKESQKRAFLAQIDLAHSLNLPVVIHSRDCTKDMFDIIKGNLPLLKNGFLLHCFGESKEMAKEYVKLGAYFSFGGVTTFKNAKKEEVISAIPIERVLTETDCPYMAPVPHRGEVNTPQYIPIIANKIASVYGVDVEEFCSRVNKNAKDLFKKL